MIATIWLYVLLDRGASTQMHRTPHPTYVSCFAALRELKMANAPGTDEAVVAWCGTDEERYYNGHWWHDKRSTD